MEFIIIAAAAVCGYLIGSVNLSIIASRLKGRDIRTMGSGNAGSTNTLRTMGKGWAAAVFLFDILKGVVPALIFKLNGYEYAAYAYGFFAIIGHCFPLYFGFKGGKGVATAIGVLLVIDTIPALLILFEFIVILLLFRFVSVASIVAAVNLPIITFFEHSDNIVLFIVSIVMAVLVVWNHRSNVIRVREGNEKAIFGKKAE